MITYLEAEIRELPRPVFSPNGKKITFQEPRTRGGEESTEIFTVNTDGSSKRRLTDNNVPDSSPSYSRDGRKIAFTSQEERGDDLDVYVMDADGTGRTRLTTTGRTTPRRTGSPCRSGDRLLRAPGRIAPGAREASQPSGAETLPAQSSSCSTCSAVMPTAGSVVTSSVGAARSRAQRSQRSSRESSIHAAARSPA